MLLFCLLQVVAVEGGTVHTLLPGDEPRVATVLVEDGKITAVGPDVVVPADATHVDATGLHVVPGLVDGMIHHDLQHDPLYLLSGVTLARDMGNQVGRIFLAAQESVRNTMPGPDLFVCGPIFDGVPPATTEAAVAQTPEELTSKLERLVERGIQFATFHLGLPLPCWEALIDGAHDHGLEVWGPVPRGATLAEALARGQDGVCYLEGFRGADGALVTGDARAALVRTFVDSGAALTPLLRVYGYRTEDPGEDPPALAYLAPYYADWWRYDLDQRRAAMAQPGYVERGLAEFAQLAALVRELHAAGVPLVPGSGAPNPWMLPGEALHDELEAWVAAGIPPYDVLHCATHGAAEALGVADERGAIAPGLVADLVLTARDPREDLSALRRPAGLVVRGVWLDQAYLDGLRQAVLDQQAEARLAAALPLDVPAPELPEGDVVLNGRVESTAFERVTGAEEYWVVREYAGPTTWVARLVLPAGLGVAPSTQTLSQSFVDDVFDHFSFDVESAGAHFRVEGQVLGNQFRIRRWLNDVAIDTNSSPLRPDFVDAGLASGAMLLAHYRGEGFSQVLYFEDMDPAISKWSCAINEKGYYNVQTATGPLVAAVSENGAFDKLVRTEGKAAARYGSIRSTSFGGPGMPRKKPAGGAPPPPEPTPETPAPPKPGVR